MRHLLCRVLGHKWRWIGDEWWITGDGLYMACTRCLASCRPTVLGQDSRRPVLRPTRPSWWRSGERAQERHRQREACRRLAAIATIAGGIRTVQLPQYRSYRQDACDRGDYTTEPVVLTTPSPLGYWLIEYPDGTEYRVSVEPDTDVQVPGGCRVTWLPDD